MAKNPTNNSNGQDAESREPFIMMDIKLRRLITHIAGPVATFIYGELLTYRNGKTGQCNPTIPTLTRTGKYGDRCIKDAIIELETAGFITVTRSKPKPNQYTLVDPAIVYRDNADVLQELMQSQQVPSTRSNRYLVPVEQVPSTSELEEVTKRKRTKIKTTPQTPHEAQQPPPATNNQREEGSTDLKTTDNAQAKSNNRASVVDTIQDKPTTADDSQDVASHAPRRHAELFAAIQDCSGIRSDSLIAEAAELAAADNYDAELVRAIYDTCVEDHKKGERKVKHLGSSPDAVMATLAHRRDAIKDATQVHTFNWNDCQVEVTKLPKPKNGNRMVEIRINGPLLDQSATLGGKVHRDLVEKGWILNEQGHVIGYKKPEKGQGVDRVKPLFGIDGYELHNDWQRATAPYMLFNPTAQQQALLERLDELADFYVQNTIERVSQPDFNRAYIRDQAAVKRIMAEHELPIPVAQVDAQAAAEREAELNAYRDEIHREAYGDDDD